jgi:hypothetical protein
MGGGRRIYAWGGDAEGFGCGRGCWDALGIDWGACEFHRDAFGFHFDALELGEAMNGSQGGDAELAVGARDPEKKV